MRIHLSVTHISVVVFYLNIGVLGLRILYSSKSGVVCGDTEQHGNVRGACTIART